MTTYKIIGLMSGTSLDGIDLCCVNFCKKNSSWNFELICTETFSYEPKVLLQLKNSTSLSALDLLLLDKELGMLYGEKINQFIEKNALNNIDAIASHGHTIYHQPEKGLTVQIGCGEAIAMQTGIQVINDFRKKDVLHGGQGAPLVPIGDQLLFADLADSFLNIGGFANFSTKDEKNEIRAFDICPINIVTNHFARALNMEFDHSGEIARKNLVDLNLLEQLNAIDIYQMEQPPSLGWEWVENSFLSFFNQSNACIESKIATATEHAAQQISKRLNQHNCSSVFITGGGAKNTFLVERIASHFHGKIVIPSEEIIDFKEALIFAFLGLLYLENIPNCIPSVTGAKKAVVGGVLHK